MHKPLILDFVAASRQAAIASHKWFGLGDKEAADKAAVDAMRAAFNQMNMRGKVVIGEGERDKAPMLFIGEEVGAGDGPKLDIAVDPLEGTTILAEGREGALAVCAATNHGGFLHAPDVYMDKIAIGFDFPEQIISLEQSTLENLKNVSRARKKDVTDLRVIVLDRPRHQQLIDELRGTGAGVMLIGDGDIAGVINTTNGVADLYMGMGGAPEGVLAAAALAATGGQFSGRLICRSDDEKARAVKAGITDFDKIYNRQDLASGDIIFAATGVTDGPLVSGVQLDENQINTQTLVMTSWDRSVKIIDNTEPEGR